MWVRMRRQIGGYRNGRLWPEVGGTIEVTAREASGLVAAGYAELVEERTDAEHTATPTEAEPVGPVSDREEGAPPADTADPHVDEGSDAEAAAVEDDPFDGLTVDELRNLAAERGIVVDRRRGRDWLIEILSGE